MAAPAVAGSDPASVVAAGVLALANRVVPVLPLKFVKRGGVQRLVAGELLQLKFRPARRGDAQ